MNEEKFRVSSAIKDIVGRELITDEFVAVFELVKNSFDANASKVQIIFDNAPSSNNPRLIIVDNGKGMSHDDLKDKWLFLAYSAKKDGTEFSEDYRNKIKVTRVFAGAKGIGRFSCDRLGALLNLITKKDVQDAVIENLMVNWEDFEKDSKKEFVDVTVNHQQLDTMPYHLEHGTVLEISNLRDKWDRSKILKLKKSLAKLINPNQDNDSQNFSIEIVAQHESKTDALKQDNFQIVNGFIENKIFETLEIKTTNIAIHISDDGQVVTTTLVDRGDLIYRIQEKNPYPKLRQIQIYLFQLNKGAKISFYNMMGLSSVDYGSVFMYKNGFRVYPFGEPGEDILLIDRRKAQGYNRYLGNRDLVGRIEIYGDNDQLRETTSRDGGLVKTQTYDDLVKFFKEYALKRLEKYVVKVIDWGDPKEDKVTKEIIRQALNPTDVKLEILDLITSLANSSNVINVEYEDDFLEIIDRKQDKSVNKILKNASRIAKKTNDPQLSGEIEKIGKALRDLQKDTETAIDHAEKAERKSERLEEELERKKQEIESQIQENLFVRSAISPNSKQIMSFQHHIRHSSAMISVFIDKLIRAIRNRESEKKQIGIVSKIDMKNKEVLTISQFITKAQFETTTRTITDDLVAFVNQYIENVYNLYNSHKVNRSKLDTRIENTLDSPFQMEFRPIQLIMIIDNLISNSYNAGASKIVFRWEQIDVDNINLYVRDNGNGIDDLIVDKVFDFRFTTTEGSGLGLYHVADLIKSLKGTIKINNKISKGVEFIITFRRQVLWG